ncbi:MAG: hypothetical protein JRJ29_20115 [Deltaproteobacteria bacterium]|nr:hypothetical protein [Deltaproteobacteria bacterium]
MIDIVRLKRLLTEIRRSSRELQHLVEENTLHPGSVPLKAAKYLLIELGEAMSNTLQHILAKETETVCDRAIFCLTFQPVSKVRPQLLENTGEVAACLAVLNHGKRKG